MPAHRFYYCVSLLISACWMLGQVATGGSDKRYDQLRQSKDSFKKKIKWFAFLMSFLKNIIAIIIFPEENSQEGLMLLMEIRTWF